MLFEIPKFHEEVLTMGIDNFYKIRNSYSEIIGIRNFDHFSINIINPEDELAILSYNPAVVISLVKNGLLPFDGTLSPTMYKKREIYTWDEAYVPNTAEKIKRVKEYKFGITQGVILVRRCEGFYLTYSFATKGAGIALKEDILDIQNFYLQMGDHCYNLIRDIYIKYSKFYHPPHIKSQEK